jgi:hypothetical protein
MDKSVIAHYTFNRSYDLAFRSRVFLVGRFAVGLTLFQGGYSAANYLPMPLPVATVSVLMPDTMALTRRDADSKLFRINREANDEQHRR